MDKEKWLRCFRNNEPLIVINNNESCNIENITVSFNIFPHVPFVNSKPFDKNISLTFKHMRLPENGLITETPTEKEIVLLDQLKEFHKLILQSRVEPTVRILALYSGFCTLWEKVIPRILPKWSFKKKNSLYNWLKLVVILKSLLAWIFKKLYLAVLQKKKYIFGRQIFVLYVILFLHMIISKSLLQRPLLLTNLNLYWMES